MNYFSAPGINKEFIKLSKYEIKKLLISKITEYYNISYDDLKSKKRIRKITEPRQICMYALNTLYNFTFEQSGNIFNRKHCTAIYAKKTIENLMEYDLSFKNHIEILTDIKVK